MPLHSDQTLDVLNARGVDRLPGLLGIRFTAVVTGKASAGTIALFLCTQRVIRTGK